MIYDADKLDVPKIAECDGCGKRIPLEDVKHWKVITDTVGIKMYCPKCRKGKKND